MAGEYQKFRPWLAAWPSPPGPARTRVAAAWTGSSFLYWDVGEPRAQFVADPFDGRSLALSYRPDRGELLTGHFGKPPEGERPEGYLAVWGTAAPAAPDTPAAPAALSTLLANPVVWLCGFALFFYGPLEASLAAWTTTYLGEQGLKETDSARLLSGFWLAFMLSRLLTALTLPPAQEPLLILVLALAAFGVLLGMVLNRSRGLAMDRASATNTGIPTIQPRRDRLGRSNQPPGSGTNQGAATASAAAARGGSALFV